MASVRRSSAWSSGARPRYRRPGASASVPFAFHARHRPRGRSRRGRRARDLQVRWVAIPAGRRRGRPEGSPPRALAGLIRRRRNSARYSPGSAGDRGAFVLGQGRDCFGGTGSVPQQPPHQADHRRLDHRGTGHGGGWSYFAHRQQRAPGITGSAGGEQVFGRGPALMFARRYKSSRLARSSAGRGASAVQERDGPKPRPSPATITAATSAIHRGKCWRLIGGPPKKGAPTGTPRK